MNWDQIEHKWAEMTRRVQSQWAHHPSEPQAMISVRRSTVELRQRSGTVTVKSDDLVTSASVSSSK